MIASHTFGNRTIIQQGQNGLLYNKTVLEERAKVIIDIVKRSRFGPNSFIKMVLMELRFAETHTVDAVHAEKDKILMAILERPNDG